ncbi:MAG: geranylgeranyl reductase family protein [Deltaproteobacteria bacterium]|nr:MAG: geranylgeranyl reductase family protein [Deltaproteobacteria bacterium]
MHCYDVVIIGAGPSGATAAYHCAKSGLDTLFVDKSQFPRYKGCGGGLSEQAMSYLDFPVNDKVIERDVYAARIRFGTEAIEVQKPYRIAALVTRSKFDYFLVQRAIEVGAKFLENERVTELRVSDECVDITTNKKKLQAKLVIGADGSQGVSFRSVSDRLRRGEYAVGVVTENTADNSEIDKYIFNSVEIHFGVTTMGYGWVFPHEGYLNVGVAGIADKLRNPKKILTDFIRERGFHGQYRFHAHRLPIYGAVKKKVRDRIILVGDAAGYVDSFLGEGIAYAILSGKIAAGVCYEALQHNDGWREDFLKLYNDMCYEQFEHNLRYSLVSAKLMHRFPNLFLSLMASDENTVDRFLEIPAGRLTHRGYLQWMIPRLPSCLLRRTVKKMLQWKDIG